VPRRVRTRIEASYDCSISLEVRSRRSTCVVLEHPPGRRIVGEKPTPPFLQSALLKHRPVRKISPIVRITVGIPILLVMRNSLSRSFENKCESFFPPLIPLIKRPRFPFNRFCNESLRVLAVSPPIELMATNRRQNISCKLWAVFRFKRIERKRSYSSNNSRYSLRPSSDIRQSIANWNEKKSMLLLRFGTIQFATCLR